MKIRNVLLVGLAGFALASCSGVKSYKNSVTQKVFLEKLSDFVKDSALLNADNPYSFTINANSNSKTETKYLKNAKTISKEVMDVKSETSAEFDSVNSILHSTGVYETYEETPSDIKTEKYDGDYMLQCDSKNFFEVDMKSKIYKKTSSSKPSDEVIRQADKAIGALLGFVEQMGILSDAKYYIDGDTFTCELSNDEEDDETTRTGKTVYQMVASSDKIELYSESEVVLKKLNFVEVITDSSSYELKKKDVKLDSVNLDKYLDGTKGFDDYDAFGMMPGSSFIYTLLSIR